MDHQSRLRWFAREVLPNEPDVRKWLARWVRKLVSCDIDEVIQESYARLWASDIEKIANPRAYLFVTAKHVVGEHARRLRIVDIELVADVESLNVADDDISAHRHLSGQEELGRLHRILATLPPKCRQAFQLKKFGELSQREIAQRMGVAESTVEKHLAKALRIVWQEMKEAPYKAKDTKGDRRGSRRLFKSA